MFLRLLFAFMLLPLLSMAQTATDSATVASQGDMPLPESAELLQERDTIHADSTGVVQQADTVLLKSRQVLNKADSLANAPSQAANQLLDSLTLVNKTIGVAHTATDSVNQLLNIPSNEINKVEEKVNSPTVDKYNDVASEVNEGLSNTGINAAVGTQEGLNVESGGSAGVPGVGGLPGLPSNPALDQLNQANGYLNQAEGASQKVKEIGGEINSLSEGDFENTKQLSGMAEKQINNTEAMKALNAETQAFGPLGLDGAAPAVPTQEELQKQAIEVATTMALDHFAGRQERLEDAIKKMSKLKRKYSRVPSLAWGEKVKASSLKGHPWQERVYPGLLFQVINGEVIIIDFLPQVNHRFSTWWTASGGAIFRANFNKKTEPQGMVYKLNGAFVQGDYRFWQSCYTVQSELIKKVI